jgi:hypothetical protein
MTSRDPAQRPTAQYAATALGDDSITPPLPLAPVVAVSDRDETTALQPGIGTVQINRGESGHRWAWIAAACVAILVALAWSVVVLGRTPPVDQTGTDGSSATAPPEATNPTPTSPTTTSTAGEPAVGPAGGLSDRLRPTTATARRATGRTRATAGRNQVIRSLVGWVRCAPTATGLFQRPPIPASIRWSKACRCPVRCRSWLGPEAGDVQHRRCAAIYRLRTSTRSCCGAYRTACGIRPRSERSGEGAADGRGRRGSARR